MWQLKTTCFQTYLLLLFVILCIKFEDNSKKIGATNSVKKPHM